MAFTVSLSSHSQPNFQNSFSSISSHFMKWSIAQKEEDNQFAVVESLEKKESTAPDYSKQRNRIVIKLPGSDSKKTEKSDKKKSDADSTPDGGRTKFVVRIRSKNSKVADEADHVSAVEEAEYKVPKSWNFRPRKAVTKTKVNNNGYGSGGAVKIGGAAKATQGQTPSIKATAAKNERCKMNLIDNGNIFSVLIADTRGVITHYPIAAVQQWSFMLGSSDIEADEMTKTKLNLLCVFCKRLESEYRKLGFRFQGISN
ncbi:hypothetical protein Q3G72_028664 [Acer saccharum]|nr:hypothetical protein Q3G72_028664 [Acer saccharum]